MAKSNKSCLSKPRCLPGVWHTRACGTGTGILGGGFLTSPLAVSSHARILGSKLPCLYWSLPGPTSSCLGELSVCCCSSVLLWGGNLWAPLPVGIQREVGAVPSTLTEREKQGKQTLTNVYLFSLLKRLILHSGKVLFYSEGWRKNSYINNCNLKLGGQIWAGHNRRGEETSGEKNQLKLYHIKMSHILTLK